MQHCVYNELYNPQLYQLLFLLILDLFPADLVIRWFVVSHFLPLLQLHGRTFYKSHEPKGKVCIKNESCTQLNSDLNPPALVGNHSIGHLETIDMLYTDILICVRLTEVSSLSVLCLCMLDTVCGICSMEVCNCIFFLHKNHVLLQFLSPHFSSEKEVY